MLDAVLKDFVLDASCACIARLASVVNIVSVPVECSRTRCHVLHIALWSTIKHPFSILEHLTLVRYVCVAENAARQRCQGVIYACDGMPRCSQQSNVMQSGHGLPPRGGRRGGGLQGGHGGRHEVGRIRDRWLAHRACRPLCGGGGGQGDRAEHCTDCGEGQQRPQRSGARASPLPCSQSRRTPPGRSWRGWRGLLHQLPLRSGVRLLTFRVLPRLLGMRWGASSRALHRLWCTSATATAVCSSSEPPTLPAKPSSAAGDALHMCSLSGQVCPFLDVHLCFICRLRSFVWKQPGCKAARL